MDQELLDICQQIFKNIISQLTLHLRFMDLALDQFTLVPQQKSIEISCDGTYLYYHPLFVIKTYQHRPDGLTRGYLHIVLHAVFRHPFLSAHMQASLWDLACDIAVENMISELKLAFLEKDENQEKQRELAAMKEKVDLLSAQKIHAYLRDQVDPDKVKWLKTLFYFDDHACWYDFNQTVNRKSKLYGEESKDDPGSSSDNEFENASHDNPHDSPNKEKSKRQLTASELQQLKNSQEKWRRIQERIKTDLETFSRDDQPAASQLIQALKPLKREKYDYATFLRKFMVQGEKVKLNDNDFDYIFYTYGLKLYHNMPLIEALEQSELANLRDFVIAIDTSGSVSGPIVQSFLEKTYNIFKQRDHFFERFNVHIIQCDAKIQEDMKITTFDQFDKYIQQMEIKGLGGTDFRPVFSHVDELLEKKELTRLQGLIYFTDGDGIYPQYQPRYRTAFVFIDSKAYDQAKVPAWAIKYLIEDDEMEDFNA